MAGQIIKLQTNIPVTGVLEYVDFIPTKNPQYSDQIAVKGQWDGAGEARIYLHLSLEKDLKSLGIIGEVNPNGSYPLLKTGARIKLTKIEQGTSKITKVELLSFSGEQAAPAAPVAVQGSLYNQPTQQATPQKNLATITELLATYKDCLKLVSGVWEEAGGDIQRNSQEIASGAHTLFIQRCQRNMLGKTENVPAF
jgi:hypothetical protein